MLLRLQNLNTFVDITLCKNKLLESEGSVCAKGHGGLVEKPCQNCLLMTKSRGSGWATLLRRWHF